MAEITRPVGVTPSFATVLPPPACRITGLLAGENLASGDVVYIAADGTVMKATGAAANAAAKVRGMVVIPTDAGEAVTIVRGCEVRYANALTPGANVYVSGVTAGNLADAASTGGVSPCGFVVDAQRIFITGSNY
jgi:hypothetical protein